MSIDETYFLQLLQDARVEVLVHVIVLDGVAGGLLRRSSRSVEVLKLVGETHSHFKWVSHSCSLAIKLLEKVR